MNLGQWIGFLSLAASLYILWEIRQVLLLVFAAVVLANSLNLLAQWFQKKGLQRPLAVMLSIGCLVAFMVAFFWLVVPPFAVQFQELFILVPRGFDRLDKWLGSLDQLVPLQFRSYIPDVNNLSEQLLPVVNRLLGGSFAFFSTSLGAIINILLILVLGLMLLIDPLAYQQAFIRLFPSFYRRRVQDILKECEFSLGRWIEGALISMGVIAVLSSVGLSIIDVPAALAQGILAGLLNFIPNIGPALSVVPPMLIALLKPPFPFRSLLVLGLYILIQQFESNFLTPYVMAQQVALLPAITLLAQVFFATIFGFWGLLLALPLTVVGQIWIRRVLLEDIMDRWNTPPGKQFSPELAPIALSHTDARHTPEPATDHPAPPQTAIANPPPVQPLPDSSTRDRPETP